MLATLVIGLREGLEAALIVGIIAAFLRRTGKPLRPMWIGVGIAVALSIVVGVALELVSAELPQAQQEGMESIIGLVAVAVVTGMIGWMNTHARNMRSDLEAHAEHALRDGTAWALVGMAFLAVLKEGFETSVFLLAAFQSSTSSPAAAAGAVIGIGIAVAIGIGIFRGGVKLNLSRFFRITGAFLVFVAAGLVLSSIRTAHEAGWIQIGQQQTINLSWLAPTGSVQAALFTGVLGIPSDPRLIELLGWIAYLVPTLLYLLWPVAHRPTVAALPRLRFGIAAVLGAAALVLAAAVALPAAPAPGPAPLVSTDSAPIGHANLTTQGSGYLLTTDVSDAATVYFAASAAKPTTHEGVPARLWHTSTAASVADRPTSVSLSQLVTLAGGRLPIGFDPGNNPGPFDAAWRSTTATSVWVSSGVLLDATRSSTTTVTLSGGGLASPRTISVKPAAPSWSVASAYTTAVAHSRATLASAQAEVLLWKLWLPIVLALAALILCGYALRSRSVARAAARERKSAQEPLEPRAPLAASARA